MCMCACVVLVCVGFMCMRAHVCEQKAEDKLCCWSCALLAMSVCCWSCLLLVMSAIGHVCCWSCPFILSQPVFHSACCRPSGSVSHLTERELWNYRCALQRCLYVSGFWLSKLKSLCDKVFTHQAISTAPASVPNKLII